MSRSDNNDLLSLIKQLGLFALPAPVTPWLLGDLFILPRLNPEANTVAFFAAVITFLVIVTFCRGTRITSTERWRWIIISGATTGVALIICLGFKFTVDRVFVPGPLLSSVICVLWVLVYALLFLALASVLAHWGCQYLQDKQ